MDCDELGETMVRKYGRVFVGITCLLIFFVPYLAVCVGAGNYVYFVRFLGSVFTACLSIFALIGLRVWDLLTYQWDMEKFYQGTFRGGVDTLRFSPPISDTQLLALVIVMIACFVLLITVGILFLWHLYYIAQNITTIEDHENASIEKLKKRGIIPHDISYPYDLGIYGNFKQVFGNAWYLWCLPLKPPGDGVYFPAKHSIPWPPRQYYLYKKYPYGKPSKKDRDEEKRRGLVRRGSEGYVVQSLTAEEREQMVQGTFVRKDRQADTDDYVSSTDYDSLEEDDVAEKQPPKDSAVDSDDEVLADRQKRYYQ
ncbi:Palmitoyltransferase [Kappamyces sp. JEL0680]|nr:Palmitoyltransferase [Kappamyces sp. JEL0680]